MIITDDLAQALDEFLDKLAASDTGIAWTLKDQFKDQLRQNRADFVLVRLDETQHWNQDVLKGAKAYGVYLLDRAERTYCCELTPSYCLYPLYHYADSEDESVLDVVDSEPMDRDPVYMHCSGIDAMIAAHEKKPGPHVYITPGKLEVLEVADLEENYDKLVEATIENYNSNHCL